MTCRTTRRKGFREFEQIAGGATLPAMPLGLATDRPRRHVRLDTLVRLRWLTVIGQSSAVLVVQFALEFEFPFWSCLTVIALSAAVNIALRLQLQSAQWLPPVLTAWVLAFDVAELALLLFFTGGLQNPFAFLFLGPVLLSATALPPRFTILLGGLAVLCATLLVFLHYPMPWDSDDRLVLPPIYLMGEYISILLAIGFIGVYAWQIAEESRQLVDALAATELVLAREQHLSQLDGLAAAAAHELATPLSTISVIARELERAIAADAPHGDDVRLLREQATRCRDILGKLTELSSSGQPFDHAAFTALIEEVVAPHRNFGIVIDIVAPANRGTEPDIMRNPAVLYGLGNIVENAVDFARQQVRVEASWDSARVEISVSDDGPGFAPDILQRLGEPYVTSRRRRSSQSDAEASGLGLGFFIAKTLLERTGATLTYKNCAGSSGATVGIRWRRDDIERQADFAAQ